MVAMAATRPHEAPARVIIIDDADRLNLNAGNCLLKTLEEPAAGTHLVLVTSAPDRILPTIRELCVGFVAYSPLGRGFLSGRFQSPDDFEEDDFRKHHPRFQGENFEKNLELVERVKEIADEKGVTASQLALGWVMAQGDDIVPIPGTTKVRNLEENVAAADIELTDDDLRRLDEVAPQGVAAGERYADMSSIDS